MTLLVLNLKVPGIPDNAPESELGRQLIVQLPEFLSFGLSLLVLGVYWVAYSIIFQLVRRADRLYHWVSLVYILCVVSIPFSANLIGLYPFRQTAVLIYGINLIAASLALYLNFWYVVKFRLIDPLTPLPLLQRLRKRILGGLGLYTAATLLSLLDARISFSIYVLISVVYIFPSKLDHHLSK
jgi:uncharacterized membrane protein